MATVAVDATVAKDAAIATSKAACTTVAVTCRGLDGPGIADALVKVVVDNSGRVLDMAQFRLEGSLVFTFVFELGPEGSLRVLTELLRSAQERGMKLDFYFPQSGGAPVAAVGRNEAELYVVSAGAITPSLLHDMDAVLCEFGCAVHEIEHRSDNKAENNGECNKLTLRVSCPPRLRLSTLYMGAPKVVGGAAGLQKVAQDHCAVMTLRWWDGLSRPNGKSMVVFELSNVLCPYNLLDAMLEEAGADSAAVPGAEGSWQQSRGKVALLKGKSVELEQRVLRSLRLTKGARLVCRALKALGFRLAILARTGFRSVSEHFRHELGIDYVICQQLGVEEGQYTGEYVGEVSDVRFRKSDLLKLMAEREGIECRNVILVGEFLRGLKATDARLMLETFGPNLHFNAKKMPDLSLALYLLGFNGAHVRALRSMHETGGAPSPSAVLAPPLLEATRVVVELGSHTCAPGQLGRALAPLARLRPQLEVSTIRQCGLQDGGVCLCMVLLLEVGEADEVLKELLLGCHRAGFKVESKGDGYVPKGTPAFCWEHYLRSRFVVTLVQKPLIVGPALKAVFGSLAEKGINIVKMERLSAKELVALQIAVAIPEGLSTAEFSSELMRVTEEHGADVAFQKDDVERSMRRLVVFDMDSTLIQQEVIDEIAKLAEVEDEFREITESALRGEKDFFESLKSRVALLKGQHAAKLFKRVTENLVLTPGARLLCSTLKKLGYKMAVISSGFLPIAQEVQRCLGLDYAFANTLEVEERTGLLTGRTCGPVVTPTRKRALLATIANVEGCKVQQTIAVGDGANDIPMLNTAGLGVAFCAKPKVRALTEFHINQKDLSTVLFLIGLSEHTTELLGGASSTEGG